MSLIGLNTYISNIEIKSKHIKVRNHCLKFLMVFKNAFYLMTIECYLKSLNKS